MLRLGVYLPLIIIFIMFPCCLHTKWYLLSCNMNKIIFLSQFISQVDQFLPEADVLPSLALVPFQLQGPCCNLLYSCHLQICCFGNLSLGRYIHWLFIILVRFSPSLFCKNFHLCTLGLKNFSLACSSAIVVEFYILLAFFSIHGEFLPLLSCSGVSFSSRQFTFPVFIFRFEGSQFLFLSFYHSYKYCLIYYWYLIDNCFLYSWSKMIFMLLWMHWQF